MPATEASTRVEVSVDGGESWREARVTPALSACGWSFWVYQWDDPRPGFFRVKARAPDGTGTLQESEPEPSFPKGAAGLRRVNVRVI